MTAQQLHQIAALRQHNYSYNFIASKLELSANTVKSICRRKGYAAEGPRKTKYEKQHAVLCMNCHCPIPDTVRADSSFCSAECRKAWRSKSRKVIRK